MSFLRCCPKKHKYFFKNSCVRVHGCMFMCVCLCARACVFLCVCVLCVRAYFTCVQTWSVWLDVNECTHACITTGFQGTLAARRRRWFVRWTERSDPEACRVLQEEHRSGRFVQSHFGRVPRFRNWQILCQEGAKWCQWRRHASLLQHESQRRWLEHGCKGVELGRESVLRQRREFSYANGAAIQCCIDARPNARD